MAWTNDDVSLSPKRHLRREYDEMSWEELEPAARAAYNEAIERLRRLRLAAPVGTIEKVKQSGSPWYKAAILAKREIDAAFEREDAAKIHQQIYTMELCWKKILRTDR